MAQVKPTVYFVEQILSSRYGNQRHHNKYNPLSELLFIICSLRTSEPSYLKSYAKLRKLCPKFSDFLEIPLTELVKVFDEAGLGTQKAKCIKSCIKEIEKEFRKPTLIPLKGMTDKECESFLTSLPGVGLKSARCVLLYSLGRMVFPVDSHCWRVCHRLGWIRNTTSDNQPRVKEMDRLQSKLPLELRYSLHVNMISFGRDICTPLRPRCSQCSIITHCKQIGVRNGK